MSVHPQTKFEELVRKVICVVLQTLVAWVQAGGPVTVQCTQWSLLLIAVQFKGLGPAATNVPVSEPS